MASETITRNDLTNILNEVLPSARQWQGFQSKTGTATIDISGLDYEELYIKVTITGNNVGGIYLPKTTLPSSVEYYRFGGWQANTNNELVILAVSSNSVSLNTAYINGGIYTSSAITSVYYR